MDKSYGDLKTLVLKSLESVAGVAGEREADDLSVYMSEIKHQLRHDVFNLVVLGEFKRGNYFFKCFPGSRYPAD